MTEVKVDIKGYRQLSQEEQDRINQINDIGDNLASELGVEEASPPTDKRWLAIAKTHLQQGLMAWRRAIAQPDSF